MESRWDFSGYASHTYQSCAGFPHWLDSTVTEKHISLDEVTVFGGKLRFLIPHEWEERDTDDDDSIYLYCHPQTDSGWFRVSLNSSTDVQHTRRET